MKFLVNGGAGFLGSNIVEELVERGGEIRVVDDFSTGKKGNIEPFLSKIEFLGGDLSDFRMVEKAVKGVDYILHQAAIPSVPRSVKNPLRSNEANVTGTLNLLWAVLKTNVKRFVYASSSSIYGDTPILPKREDMSPNPLSPYAISKLTGEYYCRTFYEIYGLETICLRYFNVFGPRQDPNSRYAAVIPKFITCMLNKPQPIIYGDGEQSRDFTYVANVVEANILAAKAEDTSGEVFNITCGQRTTINELVEKLNKILGLNIEPYYTKPRKGDVKHSLADIFEAKKKLGYTPKTNFEDGLKMAVKWFKQKGFLSF